MPTILGLEDRLLVCGRSLGRRYDDRDWEQKDSHVKVCLSLLLRVLYPGLEYVFRFLDELAVQVNCITVDSVDRIVLPKDKVRRLFVVLFLHGTMPLALLGQLVRCLAIPAFVRPMRL